MTSIVVLPAEGHAPLANAYNWKGQTPVFLAAFDPRKEKVVELRFFGGVSEEEAAEVLKVSRDTMKRGWRLAKA